MSADTADRDQSLHDEMLEEMFSPADDDTPIENETAVDGDASADESEPDVDETESSDDDPTDQPAEEAPETDRFADQRAALERLVTTSTRLPPAVRQRFLAAAGKVGFNDAGAEQPTLTVAETVRWLEESLPRQFTLSADRLEAKEHPYGDAFFHGGTSAVDDRAASEIAAAQLAATGFSRT